MPILWRYLLKNYFRILLLSITGFTLVLLTMRVEIIIHFISLNVKWKTALAFILCQIPNIISTILPISGLISSILLFERLSYNRELISMRVSGLSITLLTTPILMAALSISVVNFIVTAEIAPYCCRYANHLIHNTTTKNPLLLLEKAGQIVSKNPYANMKIPRTGTDKEIQDVIFAIKHRSNDGLNLIVGKKVAIEDGMIIGKDISCIFNVAQRNSTLYDHLIIENQESISTPISAYTLASPGQVSSAHPIQFKHLSSKYGLSFKEIISILLLDPDTTPVMLKTAQLELCRRLFFSIVTFALTFLGISLGIHIGKIHKKRQLYLALSLSIFTFMCSVAAKSFYLSPRIMICFYSLPFPILLLTSFWFQRQVVRGIE